MRAPNEFAAVQAFHQQWNGGAPIVDEAEKHRFTEAFVAHVLVPKDPRWGRKSRAAGAGPVSKDTAAYWLGPTIPTEPTDGQLDARDLLTSAGADSWNPDDDPAYNNIYARWYPIAPATSLGPQVAYHADSSDPPIEKLLTDLETRLRDHVNAAVGQITAELHASLDGLPASVATAVKDAVEKRLSETQSSIATTLAGLPKEYELRYLGRVVGTLTPKA